ncbi:MAG: pyridoxal 5'-phosphate synthase glutaminase subunit PdxT [Nanoarchaeota archaeon]|nr:pyridoxal 5'-phosphate synthase glutaminase subunit PdxT [Nanoarchaeota archaeon]MBU1704541.1 pyridoxal 5'-phosphate synthase glutaminase subunit PdxT [Nanoarchaeota archaeon]
MKVGVLALQGSFKDHVEMLKKCNVEPIEVRLPRDTEDIEALIIPGGESTTIIKLLIEYQLDIIIKQRHSEGMPIYGTCAGAIVLAKEIVGSKQPTLGLMDISVKRNAYGRQIESFEAMIDIEKIGKFPGIFIRAPIIEATSNGAKVIATLENKAVMVEQGNILVSTFHPELTDDVRVHKYFLSKIIR